MGRMHMFVCPMIAEMIVIVGIFATRMGMFMGVLVFVFMLMRMFVGMRMDCIPMAVLMDVLVGVFVGMQVFVFVGAFHQKTLLLLNVVASLAGRYLGH